MIDFTHASPRRIWNTLVLLFRFRFFWIIFRNILVIRLTLIFCHIKWKSSFTIYIKLVSYLILLSFYHLLVRNNSPFIWSKSKKTGRKDRRNSSQTDSILNLNWSSSVSSHLSPTLTFAIASTCVQHHIFKRYLPNGNCT